MIAGGTELVPRHWRDVHHVEHSDRRHSVADEHFAPTPDDHHRVLVVVSFERRMAARADLEVAKLNGQIALALPERLAGYVTEVGAVFLVGMDVHAFPPVIRLMMSNHALHLYDG